MANRVNMIVQASVAGRRPREVVERLKATLRSTSRSRLFPLMGALLSLGAPTGLLVVRALAVSHALTFSLMLQDIGRIPATYVCLTLATAVVFSFLGHRLGRLFDRLLLLAVTDPLTGLFNRRRFAERILEEMRRGRRFGRTACVLCVDIDRLKTINDRFGHKAGDQALVAVCRTLSQQVRAIDTVARIGGDELALLLPETSLAEASALSERILAQIARDGSAAVGCPTISIGIAKLDPDGEPDDALAAADVALYRAKIAGGGRAAFAEPLHLLARSGHSTLSEAARLIQARDTSEAHP